MSNHERAERLLSEIVGDDEGAAWALHREMSDPPVVLALVVEGEPVSKARARFTKKGSGHTYTPERTRAAEERIGWLAREAGLRGAPDPTGTFGIFAQFFCGTWQRRDVDNMLKLVGDALTGLVWVDDAQVAEVSAGVQRGVDDPRTHILVYRTIHNAPPTQPCEVCGVAVRQYRSTVGRYCSRSCSGIGSRARGVAPCRHCGKNVERRAAALRDAEGQVYCSVACKSAATTVLVTCAYCGGKWRKPQSQVRPRSYCTPECHAAYWREHRTRAAKGTCSDCGGPTSKRTYERCQACAIVARAGKKGGGR